MRRLAFDRLHYAAWGQVRRVAQPQVDMTRPDVPLQNLDVTPPTDLLNLLADLQANVVPQDRLPILRAEDDMTVHRMNRMADRRSSRMAGHRVASLLKASSEGEGVPYPRMRP